MPEVQWPSSKHELSPPLHSERFKSSPNSIEKYMDDSTVPLTQRTAVGDKLRVLQSDNFQFMQDPSRTSLEKVVATDDDRPIRPARGPFASEKVVEKPNPLPAVDLEELPIRPSKAVQGWTEENAVEAPAPKYNFEEMIE